MSIGGHSDDGDGRLAAPDRARPRWALRVGMAACLILALAGVWRAPGLQTRQARDAAIATRHSPVVAKPLRAQQREERSSLVGSGSPTRSSPPVHTAREAALATRLVSARIERRKAAAEASASVHTGASSVRRPAHVRARFRAVEAPAREVSALIAPATVSLAAPHQRKPAGLASPVAVTTRSVSDTPPKPVAFMAGPVTAAVATPGTGTGSGSSAAQQVQAQQKGAVQQAQPPAPAVRLVARTGPLPLAAGATAPVREAEPSVSEVMARPASSWAYIDRPFLDVQVAMANPAPAPAPAAVTPSATPVAVPLRRTGALEVEAPGSAAGAAGAVSHRPSVRLVAATGLSRVRHGRITGKARKVARSSDATLVAMLTQSPPADKIAKAASRRAALVAIAPAAADPAAPAAGQPKKSVSAIGLPHESDRVRTVLVGCGSSDLQSGNSRPPGADAPPGPACAWPVAVR